MSTDQWIVRRAMIARPGHQEQHVSQRVIRALQHRNGIFHAHAYPAAKRVPYGFRAAPASAGGPLGSYVF